MTLYRIMFFLMEIGYLGVSLQSADLRSKILGILLCIVNALIFWR
jgi:hypothetical protein